MSQSALPYHPTRRHPRTGLALQAIGFHPRTGRPLWPIMGASPDDESNPPPPKDEGWASVFPDKTPAQVLEQLNAAKAGDPSPWDEVFKDQKPEDVKKALEDSRKWESRAKGNKDKADILDSLTKMITGEEGDGKPDPEKLQHSLNQTQQQVRATQVENAVLRRAGKQEANADLLLDSRSFMSSVSELDPTADDFGTKMDAVIKKAVEENEAFKLAASSTGTTRPRPAPQQGKPSSASQGGSVAAGREAYLARHGANK